MIVWMSLSSMSAGKNTDQAAHLTTAKSRKSNLQMQLTVFMF